MAREGDERVESMDPCDEVRPRIDRVSYVRSISLERSSLHDMPETQRAMRSVGLTINMSSRGLCLLLDWVPVKGEVLRVQMPTPVTTAQTPTLADVRWVRSVIFHGKELTLVGLKFLV